MDDQHDEDVEKTDTDHAPLAVIPAVILDKYQRPGEYVLCIGEIKPVLVQVGLPLGLVPREAHAWIIRIDMHIAIGRTREAPLVKKILREMKDGRTE